MTLRLAQLCIHAAVAGFVLAGPAFGDSTSSMTREIASTKAGVPETLLKAVGTISSVKVQLPALDPSILESVKRANSVHSSKALQVGVDRDVVPGGPAASGSLTWTDVAGGSVAQWEVTSTDAAAVRVGLDVRSMGTGVEIRFA